MVHNRREKILQQLEAQYGPALDAAEQKAEAERRAESAAALRKLETEDSQRIRKMMAERDDLDDRATAMRKQLQELETKAADVSFAFSALHTSHCDRRDALWRELRANPNPELAAFRDEVRRRREGFGLGEGEGLSHLRLTTAQLTAYLQQIITSVDEVDRAIRTGLDGDPAAKEIARIRATWFADGGKK